MRSVGTTSNRPTASERSIITALWSTNSKLLVQLRQQTPELPRATNSNDSVSILVNVIIFPLTSANSNYFVLVNAAAVATDEVYFATESG